jgi:hypothetical protein
MRMPFTQVAIGIISQQMLVWLGAAYAPALPLFGLVSNALMFNVKLVLALRLYTPPAERFSASRTNIVLYCLMLGAHALLILRPFVKLAQAP